MSMDQPNVPWWVAALVASGIMACGVALSYNDPAFTIPSAAKFGIAIANAVLGVFGVYLNVKGTKPT